MTGAPTWQETWMDTDVAIRLAVPAGTATRYHRTVRSAFDWFARVEAACSRFEPASEVCGLTRGSASRSRSALSCWRAPGSHWPWRRRPAGPSTRRWATCTPQWLAVVLLVASGLLVADRVNRFPLPRQLAFLPLGQLVGNLWHAAYRLRVSRVTR